MTTLPALVHEAITLTAQIAAATSEHAADVLRVERFRVTADLDRRCGRG